MRRFACALVLLACSKPTASAATVDASALDIAKHEVVIFEPGKETRGEKVVASDEQKVLAHIFPKRVPCSGKQLSPEQARAAGEVEPMLVSAMKGSFTAPKANEVAYLVLAGECGASHAADFGSHWLVIATDGKLGAPMDVQATSFDGVVDIDEDGENELVMGSGFTNQGITTESIKLTKLHDGKLAIVKDFGDVYDDNCGSMQPNARVKGKSVRAILKKGSPPEMVIEPRDTACKKGQ